MIRPLALGALHVAVALFGCAGLFGKWVALPPLLIVLARTAVAAVTLGLIRLACPARSKAFEPWFIANGVVLAVHWATFFAAIEAADVATGLLGYASFPLFTLLLERLPGRQRWSRREIATAWLVFAGLALMVPGFALDNRQFVGLVWGILSGLSFALLAVLNRHHAARRAATDIAFSQNLSAAVVLLPVVLIAETALRTGVAIGAREIGLLLLLGVFCTALAHTLFIASLRSITARTASVVAALEPVYGIALAFLLLGERPGARALAGGVLLVAAAMIASRRRGEP